MTENGGKNLRLGKAMDPRSNQRRVLVVDDDPVIRDELAVYLGIKGYQVSEANDGAEALAKFQSEPTDAVITDIKMPWSTGDTLVRQLRGLGWDGPIIVITGLYAEANMKERPVPGADATITKPLSLGELVHLLDTLLHRQGEPT